MKTTLIKLVTLLLLICCNISKGHSQGTVPGISVMALVNFPDTAYQGQTYQQIGVTLYNGDSLFFTGSVYVFIKGDSAITDTLYTVLQLTLAPNDSATFFTNNGFQFDPSTFRAGSNIVVVWPVANGTLANDTLYDSVFYVRSSGITPIVTGIESFDAYPNPTNKYMGFRLPPNSMPESVRITDMYGRVVFENNRFLQRRIDISNLNEGYYFVLITDTNGKRYLSRVLKYD